MSDASKVMTRTSPFSVAETVARFKEVVATNNMNVFAFINHSDEAREAGLDLAEATVIIFGNPATGSPVMASAPLMGLEVPLKVLIWEDRSRTRLSYTTPGALAERYGLSPDLARVLDGVEPLTDAVVWGSTNERSGVSASW